MNTQLTKRVFIASSSEMHHERLVLVDLLADMSTKDVCYQPVKWEYVDTALREERKEDQYLRRLRGCDACITMLWKTRGQYTVEEFEDALKEQKTGNNLKKVLVLVKKDGKDADESLKGFLSDFNKKYDCNPVSFYDDTQLKAEVVKFLSYVEGRSDAYYPIRDINVVVAGLKELDEDKLEFTDIMACLNEALIKTGIRLRRVKCSDRMAEFKKQISDCDMCLNVYWQKLSECAKDNLDYAYTSLKAGNNPKHLYIFFKETDKDISDKALSEFKASFEKEYGHFYCKYSNVDTLNLNFLLQLLTIGGQDIKENTKVGDGMVSFGGITIADLDRIPFSAFNKEYQRLKKAYKDICNRLAEKLKEQKNNPNNEQRIKEIKELDKKKSDCQEEFNKYQEYLFETALCFSKHSFELESEKLSQARELFEKGDLEGANDLLNLENLNNNSQGIRNNYKNRQKLNEKDEQIIEKILEEQLTKATIVLADSRLKLEDRIDESCRAYQNAIINAEFLLEANVWLAKQLQLDKISISKTPKVIKSKRKLAEINWSTALLLYQKGKGIESLGYYLNAKNTYKEIVNIEASPDDSILALSLICNDLGVIYRNNKKYDESLKEYKEARTHINNYQRYHNSHKSELDIGNDFLFIQACKCLVNIHIAELQTIRGKSLQARILYKKAIHVADKLVVINHEAYGLRAAQAHRSFADAVQNKKNTKRQNWRAMEEYEHALNILSQVDQDTLPIVEEIAYIMRNYAALLKKEKRYSLAIDKYADAIQIIKNLKDALPTRYIQEYIKVLYNYSDIIGHIEETHEKDNNIILCHYLNLINYLDELLLSPIVELSNIIEFEDLIWRNIVNMLDEVGCPKEKSKEILEKALFFYENYSKDNIDYLQNKGAILANLSDLSIVLKEYVDAERYAKEALKIDTKNPTYNINLAHAKLFQGRLKEAKHIYCEYKNSEQDVVFEDFMRYEREGAIPEKQLLDVYDIKRTLSNDESF